MHNCQTADLLLSIRKSSQTAGIVMEPHMFCSVTSDVGVLQWQEPAESPCNVQGRGNAAEGASEGQTFSSMESLASLTDGPENHAASHNAQPSRVPLGVSPLGKAEGAGYAAARIANGSMGYTQHLQVQGLSKNPAPTQSFS